MARQRPRRRATGFLLLVLNYQKEECALVSDNLDVSPARLDALTNMHLGVERRFTRIISRGLTCGRACARAATGGR